MGKDVCFGSCRASQGCNDIILKFLEGEGYEIVTTSDSANVVDLIDEINPRNINYMPVFNFLACLDLEQNTLFLDGH
jgi:hypothetical protein